MGLRKKKDLRFGYSYWGFLGDRKVENGVEVSTPDGNAAYSWSILWEAQRRGWETWLLQKDRDAEYVNGRRHDAFRSFSTHKRYSAWKNSNKTITTGGVVLNDLDDLPDLDVVLIEWRFKIPGRNCEIEKDDPAYQPDLDRQIELLEHFKRKGTKIILWDLDHKLPMDEEVYWSPDAVFETSVKPIVSFGPERIRVEPPIIVDDLMQFATVAANPTRKLVYIGSRYERDDVIDEWIGPVSEKFPYQVEFWGNWTREPNLSECRDRWPKVLFNPRVTMSDFRKIYSTAVAVPILAKRSYMETGFITPRPWEALLFGSLPVGLSGHLGIEDYVAEAMVARDPEDLCDLLDYVSDMSLDERIETRSENVERLKHMDVRNFVDRIEEVARR
jgi:hypothetical protein